MSLESRFNEWDLKIFFDVYSTRTDSTVVSSNVDKFSKFQNFQTCQTTNNRQRNLIYQISTDFVARAILCQMDLANIGDIRQ